MLFWHRIIHLLPRPLLVYFLVGHVLNNLCSTLHFTLNSSSALVGWGGAVCPHSQFNQIRPVYTASPPSMTEISPLCRADGNPSHPKGLKHHALARWHDECSTFAAIWAKPGRPMCWWINLKRINAEDYDKWGMLLICKFVIFLGPAIVLSGRRCVFSEAPS